jgi:hypothetical protein
MTSSASYLEASAHRTVRISAEISPEDGRISVQSEAGQLAEFPYDENLFRNWQLALGNQLGLTQPTKREFDYQSRSAAVTERLAELAGATEISRLAAAVNADLGAPVFLRIELPQRELDIIPWELLGPTIGKLAHREICVYRTVRGRTQRQVTEPDPPQRVLLADSSPISAQSTAFSPERESIQRELRPMQLAGLVDAEGYCPDVDARMLTEAMDQNARAVHFAAQGRPGRVDLRQGTQAVPFLSEAFAQFFTREPVPALICLSVCDSVPAPQPVLGDPEPPGLARALAEAGIAAVIGMYSAITPEAARAFFTALYRELGRCVDVASAYALAVAALRNASYPILGLWSVPVLYSYDNVIPFPGTNGDTASSYRRIADQVARFRTELSSLRPEPGWSESTWRRETMTLRVEARARRHELRQLIELVEHEVRTGSRWARDVSHSAQDGLEALEAVVARATRPRPGTRAVDSFAESKSQLAASLDTLHKAISARIQFS